MKFAFCPGSCIPFHAATLESRPIGGIETAVIRLAEELTLAGHEVVVISQYENPPLSSPLYLPVTSISDLGPVDIFVGVRDWRSLLLEVTCKKRFFWTGDSYDQIHTIGLGDKRIIDRIDTFLAVSEWHANTICNTSGFPKEKIWILRNGIHLPYFTGVETRNKRRLIYSSTPYRGLSLLPGMFSSLKEKFPDLELHIFSGYDVYKTPDKGYDERLEREFEILKDQLQGLSGCQVHGNVTQKQLASEYMKSGILVYPNRFEETSCITAMEAQAAGCVVVSSHLGALPETVGEAGILIEGVPGSAKYNEAFINAVDSLLCNESQFAELSAAGKARAKEFSWQNIAGRFVSYVTGL